jgi:hypothetical protein
MVSSLQAIGAALQIIPASWDITLREGRGVIGTDDAKDVLPSSSGVSRLPSEIKAEIMFYFSNKESQDP